VGRTVLFVSHNEAAVRRLCKSAIYLQSGTVAFTGTPEEAFGFYRAGRGEAGFDPAHRIHSSPEMRITNAFLQQEGIHTDEIVSGTRPTLVLEVEVSAPVKFAPEVLVRDAQALPVLLAPIGLTESIEYALAPGRYRLAYEMDLPILAGGRYSLDLMLSEPKVRFYDYLEEALTFSVNAAHHGSGWEFQQSRGQGCVLFNAREVAVESIEEAAVEPAVA
jgi:lipopolysaccharide transport system ATP-binding protein